jgi:hypothetical protein
MGTAAAREEPIAWYGLELIAKLATVLEIEPAGLLTMLPGKPERVRSR